MKMNLKMTGIIILAVVIIFSMVSCEGPANPGTNGTVTNGSIAGKAFFRNSSNHSGITISLEETDGLRSVAAISAARSVASGARSISAARSVSDQTQTGQDGSYSFASVAPGTYTIYASSPDSREKAVAINNVTVEAGKSVSAADLNLTPVGSIAGRIVLNGNTTGNFGFLVSVAGTSYMAVTADDGSFSISDIPAGNNYLVIIIKGNYTDVWTTTLQSVSGGGTTNLAQKSITSAEINNAGLQWKGELPNAPASPQLNWAYYNTTNKTSYIWSGTKWDVLAAQGEKGETGSQGPQGEQGETGAQGPQGNVGTPGSIVTIGANGNWYINGSDTGKPAYSVISIGANGNWFIDGVDSGFKAQGNKGDKGDTGASGSVITIGGNGNWFIDGEDTGKSAFSVITIGGNGNWFIDGEDSGTKAQGNKGDKGETGATGSVITIGENGNWFVNGEDSGKSASSVITIGGNGNWFIDGEDSGTKAQGNKGDKGETGTPGSVITIGENGNWFIDSEDTGKATYSAISIGGNGHWFIDGEDTGIMADITGGNVMCSVTFNSNGGEGVPAQYITYGEKASRPANPVQSGFTFNDWYSDSTLSSLYDFNTPVTGSIIIYAKWTYSNALPITSIGNIALYLANQSGGNSTANPVSLPISIELTQNNWTSLLSAINNGGKYVNLDLSLCTISSSNTNGGLRDSGAFDPMPSTSSGKNRIVSFVLPDMATSIVATGSTSSFNYFNAMRSISGSNIVSIGTYVFSGCTGLTEANFPNVITIDTNAFYNCTNLAKVSFPRASNIATNAFLNCPLKDIELGLLTIPYNFASSYLSNKTLLESVSFPQATSITDGYAGSTRGDSMGAFLGCTALTSVNLPNVTSIGALAFMNCTGLTSVNFPQVTSIANGVRQLNSNAYPYYGVFDGCTALAEVNLSKVTSIGSYAFYLCGNLVELYAPQLQIIQECAFQNTGTIALTISLGIQVPTVGSLLFNNTNKNVTVKVPATATGYTTDWIATFGRIDYTGNTINVEIVYE